MLLSWLSHKPERQPGSRPLAYIVFFPLQRIFIHRMSFRRRELACAHSPGKHNIPLA
jgi:hypothetical protein